MKVFLNNVNESWIIDRIRKEWYKNNSDISTKSAKKSDLLWILSPWVWRTISEEQLSKKKVICSYYHFDFDNFDFDNFKELDKYVAEYHVISENTKKQLIQLTDKKITSIPFWINQKTFFHIKDVKKLRKNFGLNENDFLIGSFQRDTESSDLKSPKLVKGPDIFIEAVEKLIPKNKNVKIILGGKNRNYVINELNKRGIEYKYFEMVNLKTLNKLYNVLDLYIVSSRIEGGPQAILEAAVTKTPIISTDVGVASEILNKVSIYDIQHIERAEPDEDFAYLKSQDFIIPKGMEKFRTMLSNCYES